MPRSLGRRRVEVEVRVVGVGVVIIGGISVGIGLGVILILLLRVLLVGALRRTIIGRHPLIEGDVLLGRVVGRQVVLAR